MRIVPVSAVLVVVLGAGQTVVAVPYTVSDTSTVSDFDGFTLGSVNHQPTWSNNGQRNWTVEDEWQNDNADSSKTPFDEDVVDLGGGNRAWRISNAVTDGGYSAQTWAPSVAPAGEPGSALWNDRGPDHTHPEGPYQNGTPTTSEYRASFDFWSATGAAQPGLALSISPGPRQSTWRMSYLLLEDDGANGIDVFFYGTGHTGDVWGAGGSDDWTEVASDLSYTDIHNIAFSINFVDGLADVGGDLYGNDVVEIFVNGSKVHEGTTWETYYAATPSIPDEIAVDSLLFRAAGTAAPGTMGGGFIFDNVELNAPSTIIPEPGALIVWSLLAAAAVGLRWRRRRSTPA